MALVDKFKGSSKDFGRIGEGTFPARIVQVIDLGRQNTEYKGEKSVKDRLFLTFELPTETIEIDGKTKPRWLSGEFTKSTNEKAKFYKILMAAYPDAEDFKDLLGKPLLVEVGTTSGGKDKFMSAMPLPKGMSVAELQNEAKYFDIHNPDKDVFDSFPDFLKTKISESLDWNLDVPF